MRSYFKFLRKNKAYTLIDVIGLAISMMFIVLIGAYTWQETHIDSGQSKKDRMYVMALDMDGEKVSGSHWRMIRRLMDRYPEIENGTAIIGNHRWLQTVDDENVSANVVFVDSTFFDIFDFNLIRGDKKKVLSSPNSIVVTEEFARKIWKDEDPMGKTIVYNTKDDALIVTGIMSPMENTSINVPGEELSKSRIDALIPFEMTKYYNRSVYNKGMNNALGAEVILLAREGVDLTEKEKEIHDFAKEIFWILDMPGSETELKLIPFSKHYFSEYYSASGALSKGNSKMVKIIFSTGLAILLFALMNYINLTVALAGQRAKEMATRRLLGDSRLGIMMKLIGESTLLCAFSALIGLGLAWLALPYAENLLGTRIYLHACVNPATISLLIGIIIIMGVLAGITPAVLISSSKPIDVVRGTFRRHTKMIFSKVFIVIQNVVTIVMIASAITMYLQIKHLVDAPLGYNTEDIMVISNYGDKRHTDEFMQKVKQLSGVEMISASCGTPVDGGNNNTMTYEGRTISFQTFIGDENYMKILGIKTSHENNTSGSTKTYLNHQAINELGINDDAQSFRFYDEDTPISGILKDFYIRTIVDDQHPVMIQIVDIKELTPWGFVIKVKGDHEETLRQVNDIFKEVYGFENEATRPYISQIIADRFKEQTNLMKIVAIFAGIAIVISLLGLVAMSTYFVQQRRKEIAVKKVLGCGAGEMLRRLLVSFMTYVVIAFIIAIPVIYWLMNNWLSEFSYRIPLSWWIYALAGLTCIIVSLLSVYVQSRKAADENPILALYQN